ncbi:helix-turn-helix domain-containing protein [Methylobacterium komagatae]
MILRRAYKFCAYPDTAMAEALTRAIGCTRLVYNSSSSFGVDRPI